MRWSLEDGLDILTRQKVDTVLHHQGQLFGRKTESILICLLQLGCFSNNFDSLDFSVSNIVNKKVFGSQSDQEAFIPIRFQKDG